MFFFASERYRPLLKCKTVTKISLQQVFLLCCDVKSKFKNLKGYYASKKDIIGKLYFS